MRTLKKIFVRLDGLIAWLVIPAAWLLRTVRRIGVDQLPACRKVLLDMGVFPIRNHFYEPQFDYRYGRQLNSGDRSLPGIDWNESGQLEFLKKLTRSEEVANIPCAAGPGLRFHLNNGLFESGDAEVWYQVIRHLKPRNIIEIGSGYSTLLAIEALQKTRDEDPGFDCAHICIEPFQKPWLEATGAKVIRKPLEEVNLDIFQTLGDGDILFIDSSHVIRPDGDVLLEYLEILPRLNMGVFVHVHDIFSPRNYPRKWLEEKVLFWNEQYLLEAFLCNNSEWEIVLALNLLHRNHFLKLQNVAPLLTSRHMPGSLYIRKKM